MHTAFLLIFFIRMYFFLKKKNMSCKMCTDPGPEGLCQTEYKLCANAYGKDTPGYKSCMAKAAKLCQTRCGVPMKCPSSPSIPLQSPLIPLHAPIPSGLLPVLTPAMRLHAPATPLLPLVDPVAPVLPHLGVEPSAPVHQPGQSDREQAV